mgnify:CR=1 FL=1
MDFNGFLILSTPVRCVGIPAGAFFSEKMTSLEISDMYFVKFDVFGQYLNNIWSMFVQQVSVQVYMSPKHVATQTNKRAYLYTSHMIVARIVCDAICQPCTTAIDRVWIC